MRLIPALLLIAALAVAGEKQGRPRLDKQQRAEVVRVVGAPAWGAMPKWRQDIVFARYARYVHLPERKQSYIRERGLRAFLLQPRRGHDLTELPPPLQEAVRKVPRKLRPLASKLAFLRLRQLRLDRGLRRVPRENRWPLFRRLFPEPFDQEAAKAAHEELRVYQARAIAARLRREMRAQAGELTLEQQKRIVHEAVQSEEQQVVERVTRELRRLRGLDAERARRLIELQSLAESVRFATPRQRELIRYALRPEECPLLDLTYLGPRPEDPAARRLWEGDFKTLGRLRLLCEAGLPNELVLHLAGTGSAEDFLRSIVALRRPKPS